MRLEDLVEDYDYARARLETLLGRDPGAALSDLTFEKLSGGRQRGVIDSQHHYRTGATQDQWRHEMDPVQARAMYEAYRTLIDRFYPAVGAEVQRIA